MPRRAITNYSCIRCGFDTHDKSVMRRHFYQNKNLCCAIENDIILTDEIKEHILANRIYKLIDSKTKNNNNLKIENLETLTIQLPENSKVPTIALTRPSRPIPQDNTCSIPVNNKISYTKGYIYLLKEREFEKSNEEIFKVGKTSQAPLTRLQSYPKGSTLIALYPILHANIDIVEKTLLHELKKSFVLRKDIGSEYFHDDSSSIIETMRELIVVHDVIDAVNSM